MRKGGTGHTASKQNQDLNSGSLTPKSMCLTSGPYVCGAGKGIGGNPSSGYTPQLCLWSV